MYIAHTHDIQCIALTCVHYMLVFIYTFKKINIQMKMHHNLVTALTEEHIIGAHTDNLRCNYSDWIPAWKSHLEWLPVDVKVPPAAIAIFSKLVASNWRRLLSDHPNRPLVDFFINGVVKDFVLASSSNPNHYSLPNRI